MSSSQIRRRYLAHLLLAITFGLFSLVVSFLLVATIVDGKSVAEALSKSYVFVAVWLSLVLLILASNFRLRTEPLFSGPKDMRRIGGILLFNLICYSFAISAPKFGIQRVAIHAIGFIGATLCFVPCMLWTRKTAASLPADSPLLIQAEPDAEKVPASTEES